MGHSGESANPIAHRARFAGAQRLFCLRIGEIGELEMLCGAGVAAIYGRVATLTFKNADIRETIRLGLIGGGLDAAQADFFVERYCDGQPLNNHVQLAADILRVLFEGAAQAQEESEGEDAPKKTPGETFSETAAQAISPRSSPLAS